MAGKVEVEIGQLRSVGSALDAVATRIAALKSKVDAEAAAYDGSWGSDDFGREFSGGDNGYKNSHKNLKEVLDSKVALFNSYAQGLKDAATSLQVTEDGNTESFR